MYHFNGRTWIRLAAPQSSTINTTNSTNLHGVTSNSPVAECLTKSPVSSTSLENENSKISKQVRRLPLKQLFPDPHHLRTPTPMKKRYAELERAHGKVEKFDITKSPELYDDLKEIILQDVILPPKSKRSRGTVSHALVDQASTSAMSATVVSSYRARDEDSIFDTTSTPSKVLNDSSFLMSPPLSTPIYANAEADITVSRPAAAGEFIEPQPPPTAYSPEWYRITCGRTSAQLELAEMAKQLLRSTARRQSSTSND